MLSGPNYILKDIQMTVSLDKNSDPNLVAAPPEEKAFGGAYEAADRQNIDLQTWQPMLSPADDEILSAKEGSEARIRDIQRNNAIVSHGVDVNKDSIVGAVYTLSAKPYSRALDPFFDDKWSAAFQAEVEVKFGLWASSPNANCDARGVNPFTEMIRLAVGLSVVSDEILASVEWLGTTGRSYGTAIQMIDIDRLSTPMEHRENKNLRGGIRKDNFGRPLGYYIRTTHPGNWRDVEGMFRWKYVEARKNWGRRNIIHIYESNRPEQTRGISKMVAALKTMKMLGKFSDVSLQNAVLNASYAMTIESDSASSAIYSLMGNDGMTSEDAHKETTVASIRALENIGKFHKNTGRMQINGAKIPHLYPGTKLNHHDLSPSNAPGSDLEKSFLRTISASLGVSYEQLSGNFSDNSYAGIRAAIGESQKHLTSRKRFFGDRFASEIYRAWLEEAILRGHIDTIPMHYRNIEWLFSGQNFDALSRAEWIGASKTIIDPVREARADILLLGAGLTTREAVMAKCGQDWRDVDTQNAREEENARMLKLSYAPAIPETGAA